MNSAICPCGTARIYRKPPRREAANNNGWRGLCSRCWKRWVDHGYPVTGAPEPSPQKGGWEGGHEGYLGRLEDYRFLRRLGASSAEAALRLGLTRRTLRRYEAAIRAGAA